MNNQNEKNIYDFSIKLENDYYFVNGSIYKRVDIDIDNNIIYNNDNNDIINNNNIEQKERLIENFTESCTPRCTNKTQCWTDNDKIECENRNYNEYAKDDGIINSNNNKIKDLYENNDKLYYNKCINFINTKKENAEKLYNDTTTNKNIKNLTKLSTRNTSYDNIVKEQIKILNKTSECNLNIK
jgi:hypothetical protein